MKKLCTLLCLFTSSAWANLHLAPPDFDSSYGRVIFVDFKQATYNVTYDIENQKTTVKSKIIFNAEKTGKPLFDLVPSPYSVKVNGKPVKEHLICAPGDETKFRLADVVVSPGQNVLEIENTFDANVSYHYEVGNVSSAFWIRDLKERLFLEQYVPSNFEYDQYQMTLNVTFSGVEEARQEFFTNGVVTKTDTNSWKIEYPAYFTVSCPFFHTSPKNWLRRLDFTYPSIDGRNIPVTVYSPWRGRTRRFKAEALRVFKELEADYGPWGHPSFVAYGTFIGTGGMEHSGAAATSFAALDHEMLHSYFAKGVMPANGNSGWIDEAIASWRDKGYLRLSHPGYGGSDLGAHSVYKRNTDDRAYVLGAGFMGYIDYRLQDIGGLKAFLRGYFSAYNHTVITVEHFKNNLEFFSGINFDEAFNTYILGTNTPDTEGLTEVNPNHVPLTKAELKSLL